MPWLVLIAGDVLLSFWIAQDEPILGAVLHHPLHTWELVDGGLQIVAAVVSVADVKSQACLVLALTSARRKSVGLRFAMDGGVVREKICLYIIAAVAGEDVHAVALRVAGSQKCFGGCVRFALQTGALTSAASVRWRVICRQRMVFVDEENAADNGGAVGLLMAVVKSRLRRCDARRLRRFLIVRILRLRWLLRFFRFRWIGRRFRLCRI